MADILLLTDGIEAVSCEDIEGVYEAIIKINGCAIEVDLIENKENTDTKEALKYTFEKYYRIAQEYNEACMKAICYKMLPMLSGDSYKKLTPEYIRSNYVIKAVAILDVNRESVFAPANTRVELTYADKNDDENEIGELEISVAGSMENGIDDYYIGGMSVAELALYPPHELSTGDVVEYSHFAEVYSGSVDVLGYIVDCYFELDDDCSKADAAFALFEKVYPHIYKMDHIAKGLIFANMPSHMDDIRKTLGDDDLTIDEMKEEIVFESAVFGPHDELEFSYVLIGDKKDLKATAMGTFKNGFTRYLIEYLDVEE